MMDVISVILAVFCIAMILAMLLYAIADRIKFLQKFYCKIGWHCHMKDYQFDYSDGASAHCTCKWCGYQGMVDSQGNLF